MKSNPDFRRRIFWILVTGAREEARLAKIEASVALEDAEEAQKEAAQANAEANAQSSVPVALRSMQNQRLGEPTNQA